MTAMCTEPSGPRSAMPGPHMLLIVAMKSESRLNASAKEAAVAKIAWKSTSDRKNQLFQSSSGSSQIDEWFVTCSGW